MNRKRRLMVMVPFIIAAALLASSAWAVPHWARQYDVSCTMCHLTVPKLNTTGLGFQANGFRFDGLDIVDEETIDFSLLLQGRYTDRDSAGWNDTYLREVEIIGAAPINKRGGYYFAEWLPFNNSRRGDGSTRVRNGRFEDLYFRTPICLDDNLSLTAGQFRAGSQVDVSQRLSISTPLAFDAKVGAFSYASRSPSLSFSYFDGDSGGSPIRGWTHNVVIPFRGELAFNDDFELGSRPEGVFMESYRRSGLKSYGCYSFIGEGQTLFGGVAQNNCGQKSFQTLNVGWSTGDDALRLSFEEEYMFSEHFALGARYDHHGGATDRDAGIFYANFDTPTADWTKRFRAEYRHETGNKQFMVQAEGLF